MKMVRVTSVSGCKNINLSRSIVKEVEVMKELFFEPERRGGFAVTNLRLASDVPDDCEIYVFYVPGMTTYNDLKKALQDYGEAAGKNIFVGLWDLDAPSLKGPNGVLTFFQIRSSPAIVVSGKPDLSTDGQTPVKTAFARIDDSHLLNDLTKAEDCISRTCNLFLQGKVKDAISSARNDKYKADLSYYLKKLGGDVVKFLNEVPITWTNALGTFKFGAQSGSGASPSAGSGASSSTESKTS